MPRTGRFKAMVRSLLVSLAQVIAAAVVTYGCLTVLSVAVTTSDGPPGPGGGVLILLVALPLGSLSAMFAGPLVAGKLGLANGAYYCLSVIVIFVIMCFALSSPRSGAGNLLLVITVLTCVNLLIGFLSGMRPDRTRRG